jgi:hypothetical protein
MRDPHIHAEKTPIPGFGHAAMRDLIAGALGAASDMPKTVGTGCGRRRPPAMTSTVPENVTCLACRDYARAEHLKWAEISDAAAALADDAELSASMARAGKRPVTRAECEAQARKHRAAAARYATAVTG